MRAGLRQGRRGGQEKVAEIRKCLDAFPETPHDTALTRRNVLGSKMPTSYSYAPGGSESTPLSVPGCRETWEEQAVDDARGLRIQGGAA